jgi:ankyrin repeat protein
MNVRTFPKMLTAVCLAAMLGGMTAPESPVADAAMRGDVATVRSLLQGGADVNETQGDGMTALHWAARNDNTELADILIYAGANLDAGTRIGNYTPLHVAAREGNAGVAEILLESGSDASSISTNSGATPLHLAARSGNKDIVSGLIKHGADVEARDLKWGQTPLVFAAAMNRTSAIEVLLAAGADPNAASLSVDVVEMAEADGAADGRIKEVIAEFKEREGGGAGWQPTPSQVQAAIDLAREIQTRWPDIPKDDDEDKADAEPDAEAAESEEVAAPVAGEPAVEAHEATEGNDDAEGHEDGEPDDDAEGHHDGEPDEDGETHDDEGEPADYQEGEEEGTQLVRPLSYAQQVDQWGGLSPLHHAVRQGHVEATLALLQGGADIDQPIGDNTTPLLMASLNGQWDLASILLERGADPTIESSAGATPLYAVLEREWEPRSSYSHPTEHQQQETSHLEMMENLLEAGADPNARLNRHLWYMEYTFGVLRGSGINLKGATPFWRAAYALDLAAMRMLASYGADADIRTMKPPQRRRGPQAIEEEDEPEEAGDEENAAEEAESEGEAHAVAEGAEQHEEDDDEAEHVDAAEADDDEAGDNDAAEAEDEEGNSEVGTEEDEDDDKSGLPPVPTNGPAIHAIHAASGVGYGQSFAGNAHRYVPDGWLPAVRYLVEEMGADVNARDANGYTALHHAASRGDNDTIRFLIEHGADVMVISRKGETVADMANGPVQRVRPFPETVALLEESGSANNHNCISC